MGGKAYGKQKSRIKKIQKIESQKFQKALGHKIINQCQSKTLSQLEKVKDISDNFMKYNKIQKIFNEPYKKFQIIKRMKKERHINILDAYKTYIDILVKRVFEEKIEASKKDKNKKRGIYMSIYIYYYFY